MPAVGGFPDSDSATLLIILDFISETGTQIHARVQQHLKKNKQTKKQPIKRPRLGASSPSSSDRSEVSPVDHLAELLLQGLGGDARQTVVQRGALHQAVHRGGRDLRQLVLPVSQATVPIPRRQEVFHDGEELLPRRQ